MNTCHRTSARVFITVLAVRSWSAWCLANTNSRRPIANGGGTDTGANVLRHLAPCYCCCCCFLHHLSTNTSRLFTTHTNCHMTVTGDSYFVGIELHNRCACVFLFVLVLYMCAFNSYVKSILDYCYYVYNPVLCKDIDVIEKAQRVFNTRAFF